MRKDLTHLGDVVLQEVLVQGVSDLQPADECECRYLLIIVRDFGQLALKEVDIGLEAIPRLHLDREEVMAAPLGFLVRGVLYDEGIGDL